MAAVLLSAGEKGERRSLAHSKIMIHQPSGGAKGPASDIYIAAKEMEKCQDMLYRVLAENMGKDYDYVKRICDRDYWLTPDEAVAEGVIDMVINKNK
jgi:ATP-dependent Clp protease protease subunit